MLDLIGDKWGVLKCRYMLTQREMQVAQLICSGYLRREIAPKLGMSVKTEHYHQRRLFRKMGIHGGVQLLLKCLEILCEGDMPIRNQVQAKILEMCGRKNEMRRYF